MKDVTPRLGGICGRIRARDSLRTQKGPPDPAYRPHFRFLIPLRIRGFGTHFPAGTEGRISGTSCQWMGGTLAFSLLLPPDFRYFVMQNAHLPGHWLLPTFPNRFPFMIIVADHLRDFALGPCSDYEVDMFGRSSFNRYYYACYWEVRVVLSDLYLKSNGSRVKLPKGTAPAGQPKGLSNIKDIPHIDIPDHLRGPFRRYLNDNAKRLYKRGVLQSVDYRKTVGRAERAVGIVAESLKKGYMLRCIADYSLEIKIAKLDNRLSLDNTKLTSMQTLYNDVRKEAGVIRQCLKDLQLL